MLTKHSAQKHIMWGITVMASWCTGEIQLVSHKVHPKGSVVYEYTKNPNVLYHHTRF